MEENQNRQLRGLAGLEIGLPCHLPDSPVSVDEIDKALGGLIRRDDRLHLYKHFDSDDPDLILDRVRFLVSAAGCKIVTLDHISQLVADQQSDKERQYLDYLSTKFVKMTEDLGFAFLMISHLNDSDQTRGSRYPAKIAATHIQLKRNVSLGENTTEVYIIKNRFGSRTGPAGRLYFDPSSFMLRNADEIEKEVLPPV
jgi:twinkle protein